jgi:hypothetical protein
MATSWTRWRGRSPCAAAEHHAGAALRSHAEACGTPGAEPFILTRFEPCRPPRPTLAAVLAERRAAECALPARSHTLPTFDPAGAPAHNHDPRRSR